jgi:hypothetical protein
MTDTGNPALTHGGLIMRSVMRLEPIEQDLKLLTNDELERLIEAREEELEEAQSELAACKDVLAGREQERIEAARVQAKEAQQRYRDMRRGRSGSSPKPPRKAEPPEPKDDKPKGPSKTKQILKNAGKSLLK